MPALRSTRCGMPFGALAMLCLLTAASAQASHPRPAGALPLRTPFVPAYEACTAPNRTHGPPLAFPSCNPPTQTSAQATVGTPDAFGGGANSVSYLRINGYVGNPGPPEEGDMLFTLRITDVRCVPTGVSCGTVNASGPADYSGQLRVSLPFRVTDHYNAVAPGGGIDPATVQDFAFEFVVSCAQTASTSTGSTCNWNTTTNSVIPGSVKEQKRAIYELEPVLIYDGGADGDATTTGDNAVFLRQGIFVP